MREERGTLIKKLLEDRDLPANLFSEIQGLVVPKRKPMTGSEISQGFRADKDAINAESYWAGVALAEKHHGVGVDYED